MRIGKKDKNKDLNEILDVLERFAIGQFAYRNHSYQEGVVSKIHNRLEKLGESIELHRRRLIEEKEATKALITDISHQLKTPLAGLKTSHDLLQEEQLTAAEQQEFIKLIGKQIAHLENLTDALVNISRLEVGIILIRPEWAEITATVKSAAESIKSRAEGKNITVEMAASGSWMLNHDPQWTREALVNILDNAVKYSPAGSRIRIGAAPGQFFYRIEIADEGIGIAPDEAGRIYSRFYRGKAAAVKETAGSGVGLYLSRKICEEQGGTIISKAGRSGIGTVFIVQLPLS